MKLPIIIFSFLLWLSVTALAGKVEKTYTFGTPVVSHAGSFQKLNFDNTMLTALPGHPVMPYKQVSLMLPPGEIATAIDIILTDEVVFAGKFQIYPQQEVKPVSSMVSNNFIRDEQVYGNDSFIPANPKGQLVTSFLNGRSFALSSFTPVKYNPVTGEVRYYKSAKIVVTTAVHPKAVDALQNAVDYSPEALRLAENKEMGSLYANDRQPLNTDYEYLIITTTAYAGSFGTLISNYLKEGIRTEVATVESISSTMTGVDLPDKIRKYIIQEYQTNGIEYVLLGGDTELVPSRGFYCYVQSGGGYTDQNIPADLYYSALDGNWNTNNDDRWGEPGEDDLLPDIAVARFPFSNAGELSRMINKTFKYQFEPVPGEFRNILMAGESLYANPLTWGSDYLELLKGERNDNGYTTIGMPLTYNFDYLYEENGYWGRTDLLNKLNQGRPMLNHVGHANESYVMMLTPQDITDANFSGLNGTTHNYTIVYTHGCYCGAFDYNDCIAEKMVTINNFAAVFIGNSRYGWFNEGQTEGPSAHLHREYMDALYHDKLGRVGRAHMESKIATAPWVTAPGQWEPGALRWCFYDCNVLGDPALAVFTDNSISINATYPTAVQLDETSINVQVTSSGFPVPELTCVLMKDGIIIGKAETDVSGKATISIDVPVTTCGQAQLIISGRNLTPVTYNIEFVICIGVQPFNPDELSLFISPNPAVDVISVEVNMKERAEYYCEIADINGKICATTTIALTDYEGRLNQKIDISALKPGYYTCIIRANNRIISKPFIIK